MAYQIIGTSTAIRQLEAIHLKTMIDSEMLAAYFQIHADLEVHPLRVGNSLTSSIHRFVYRSPLVVEYYVIEDDKRVLVMKAYLVD